MRKISIGILGATGTVGQMFVQMLDGHPWFEVTELAASDRSAGKSYGELMRSRWSAGAEIPEYARDMVVKECHPGLDCSIVFSALDSDVAGGIEEEFANHGYAVSTNARNHRMDADVPISIPEINPEHLGLIERQRTRRGSKGFIITNGNCSTISFCMGLKPLYDAFGVEKAVVTTLQALSGAGYPGVPSLDIVGNVIPFINGEEEKMQSEPLKIFGRLSGGAIRNAGFAISATCTRVGVVNGHTESVSVKLSRKADPDEVIEAWEDFNPLAGLGLPSAPRRPITYTRESDRPQPRKDASAGNGMTTVIGRLRECSILDYKFVLLGHNLVRGAAGSAILNAEMLVKQGYIDGQSIGK